MFPKDQKRWDKQYKRNFAKIYNSAAARVNNGEIDKFNKKYGHLAGGKRDSEYVDKYNKMFDRIMTEEAEKRLGKYPR